MLSVLLMRLLNSVFRAYSVPVLRCVHTVTVPEVPLPRTALRWMS